MGKDKDDKKKHHSNPFNNEIQLCCDCGGCCLVHQQFTIEEDLPASQFPGTLTVFEANSYEPACVPGQVGPCLGAAETELADVVITQVQLRTLPFGTVIARNIGNFAYDVTLVGTDTEDDVITKTVPPGAQVALSGVVRRVDLQIPSDPIHALFNFDLFFIPPNPV
ncbi:hypothetical protein QFZ87_000713 [Bacillus sp. SLBN-46]|uniref:hypothetical protein n=1 Tax=Bacillus sp. SLBN-46 TaxID=3042283 RepID=UPI002854820A|nr:hypothetical protein [Bacillus sp. SLBN-46]MDR6121116.1 hypothetical protein [Bacillus sp. SLBN-46]